MVELMIPSDKEWESTPRSGWKDGKFYLISGGGRRKRVYRIDCEDLPAFARKLPSAPHSNSK